MANIWLIYECYMTNISKPKPKHNQSKNIEELLYNKNK